MANENDIKKQNEERYCPPGMMADNLEEKLEQWMGQTVTVYLYDTEVTLSLIHI